MSDQRSALQKAVSKLLNPLVRLLLRNGLTYSEFAEIAKSAYVRVALKDFSVPGRKPSQTRVSVLTGLHRHEVAKILKADGGQDSHSARHHRAARIISAWLADPRFNDDGIPNVLNIDSEFAVLVADYGADVTTRAVLDELVRVGAVNVKKGKRLELLVRAFTPSDSDEDLIHILGDSVTDLLSTLDHNLASDASSRRLQMSVVHSNLPNESLRNIELISRDKAMSFLEDLNQFFATQDRDSNPRVIGTGRNRAGIGLYYFQQPFDSENQE